MQKWQDKEDRIQIRQNVKQCKCDKIQKDKIQMWQNTKRQFTNMIEHKKAKHECDNKQMDKIQIWHNTKRQNKY